MKRKRFSEEPIIGILRESGAEMTTREIFRTFLDPTTRRLAEKAHL
ncbi:MAG: hypothetical protein L7V86_00265 [Verrucomicrobiales bacterium]|nr:hypothetical protein [Verrucomicrobiales bacterium]